jgi:hypothetical protein
MGVLLMTDDTNVEHTTYAGGDKQEIDACFTSRREATQFALGCLQRHGGRIWINNVEFTRKELENETMRENTF